MSFEFKSNYYKYFLLVSICAVLIWDTLNLPFMLLGKYEIQSVYLVMAVIGYLLKITIFVVILQKKGPIKVLVSIWGGLMILGALSGYVALLTAATSQPLMAYLYKTAFLVFGLALVLPLSNNVVPSENA